MGFKSQSATGQNSTVTSDYGQISGIIAKISLGPVGMVCIWRFFQLHFANYHLISYSILTITDVRILRQQSTDNYGEQYESAVSITVVNCN